MNPNEVSRPGGYIKFIAYLQIIGIILVVAGHSLHEYPDGHNGWSTLFYRMFLTFRMPLFMFVSGLLMVYTTKVLTVTKTTPKAFAVNKVKRLLLPFMVLTAITFFPRSVAGSMADDPYPMTVDNFLLSFVLQENMPIPFFWFLQASFILLTVTFTILYLCRRNGLSGGIVICCLCGLFLLFRFIPLELPSALAINKIQQLGVFFMAGCAYCVYAKDVDRFIPWTKTAVFVTFAAIWAVTFFLFENTEAIIICSLSGIAMSISFAKILEEREWGFLDHLMGANYMIFLLSWYCNIAAQQVLAHFVELPWWVHTALSLIAGIYVPWLAYKYLQRHQQSRWVKVTAFLLGQSFRQKDAKH